MKFDMLSWLPDDVLVHILSLMPLNSAASTSILSRRWLHLWKYRTKLNFSTQQMLYDELSWLNSVVKSHRAPSLQEFTIDFFADQFDCHDMAKWLDFAFSRRVEKLCLNFNGWSYSFFYRAPQLQEIVTLLVPTSSTGMRSLKVLHLLGIKTDGEAIRFFLENCPLLEKLLIFRLAITSDLELVGPSLRFLELQPNFKNKKFPIKVYAPNLTMLTIGMDSNRIFLKDVPKLVDMVFRCCTHATMQGFAAATSQLETLAISMMTDQLSSFSVPEMPKLKKLVVDDRFHDQYNGTVPFPVTSFLRASPCLEEIEIQIRELVLEEGVGVVFQHASLKRFKLWWSCGESPLDNYIKLVRYVVDNCVGLEEIEISRCDDGKKWRSWCYVVVDDDSVRVATEEERVSFENMMQRKIPGQIKVRVANHFHKSPDL